MTLEFNNIAFDAIIPGLDSGRYDMAMSAMSDTVVTEDALRRADLTVHVSTKPNRSHVVHGRTALILPTLGRTESDLQHTGEQFVTVEDSMSVVHRSRGRLAPASDRLLSEVSIVCRLARAVLGPDHPVPWEEFETRFPQAVRDADGIHPEWLTFV